MICMRADLKDYSSSSEMPEAAEARPAIRWPKVVLFGASITEYSFSQDGGWGAILADRLRRKCDVVARGFCGYNTRMCRALLPALFPTFGEHIAALTILLGSNDSTSPEVNSKQHVPLEEYKENLTWMVDYLEVISDFQKSLPDFKFVALIGTNKGCCALEPKDWAICYPAEPPRPTIMQLPIIYNLARWGPILSHGRALMLSHLSRCYKYYCSSPRHLSTMALELELKKPSWLLLVSQYVIQSQGVDRTKVILISPPMFNSKRWAKFKGLPEPEMDHNPVVEMYAATCILVAQTLGCSFVDLFGLMETKHQDNWNDLLTDGCHFSSEGSQIVAEAVWPLIEERTRELPHILPALDDMDSLDPASSITRWISAASTRQ